MPQLLKASRAGRKPARTVDVLWLARLTHPLVFFGAALAIYEGTIGTALLVGTHTDTTTIVLCVLMAVVIIAAMATVALLVFKKPKNLMFTAQDTIADDIKAAMRVKQAARILLEEVPPRSPSELFQLMDRIEAALAREE